jgi:pimeloyl-ACP methyl ester carboxylesterase
VSAIDHDGLATFSAGRGDPLLLMPWPHAASVFGHPTPTLLVEHLVALGRRVVSFDPPGAGRSTRPAHLDMAEVLDCADEALAAIEITGPVDEMGHSQGGLAALALALARPERVRRLVLVCTASGGPAYLHATGAIGTAATPSSGAWGYPGGCSTGSPAVVPPRS